MNSDLIAGILVPFVSVAFAAALAHAFVTMREQRQRVVEVLYNLHQHIVSYADAVVRMSASAESVRRGPGLAQLVDEYKSATSNHWDAERLLGGDCVMLKFVIGRKADRLRTAIETLLDVPKPAELTSIDEDFAHVENVLEHYKQNISSVDQEYEQLWMTFRNSWSYDDY